MHFSAILLLTGTLRLICISQVRLSSHNLEIEKGRHNNVLLNNNMLM